MSTVEREFQRMSDNATARRRTRRGREEPAPGSVIVLSDPALVLAAEDRRLRLYPVTLAGTRHRALGASQLPDLEAALFRRLIIARTGLPGVLLGSLRRARHAATGTGTATRARSRTRRPATRTRAQTPATQKAAYIALCGGGRKEQMISAARAEMETRAGAVETAQRALVSAIRALATAQDGLAALEKLTDGSATIEAEFDQLLTHPELERLEVGANHLVAHTKTIEILYKDDIYTIGRFAITINADGTVRMHNKAGRQEEADHPHVLRDEPCLGNIMEVLPNIIGERKYAAAVAVCIKYLQSYTYADGFRPYHEISYWPSRPAKKESAK